MQDGKWEIHLQREGKGAGLSKAGRQSNRNPPATKFAATKLITFGYFQLAAVFSENWENSTPHLPHL